MENTDVGMIDFWVVFVNDKTFLKRIQVNIEYCESIDAHDTFCMFLI